MEQVRKHHIDIHTTEPNRHNQSKVEGVIRGYGKTGSAPCIASVYLGGFGTTA